jgi:hypothetical protein
MRWKPIVAPKINRNSSDRYRPRPRRSGEQERPDILEVREASFESQNVLDPERLVFIDETWASNNLTQSSESSLLKAQQTRC